MNNRKQEPAKAWRARTVNKAKWIQALICVLLLSGCGLLPTNSTQESGGEGTQPADAAKPRSGSHEKPAEKPALPSGVFTGQVSYRERIALLPGTFVRVVLERESKLSEPPVEIAEQIFHPAGQVPFQYRLQFDPQDIRGGFRYVIKGQIFSEDERLLFASQKPVAVEPLGPDRKIDLRLTQVPLTHQSHMQPVTAAVSRVFQCGDFTFGTRTGIGEIALYLPSGMTVLSQVRAASGVRYQEGDILFWMKGEQAMLSFDGTLYSQCQRNVEREARDPVERRPVDFRAVGHEPPWLLEIVGDHNINLITEYGQKRLQLPNPQKTSSSATVSYRASDEENRLAVRLTETRCADTMADKTWPYSVSVWWNSRHYTGCGQYLLKP